jgi:hypothetical protein
MLINLSAVTGEGQHGGCGELHARLVSQLGRWLDSKSIAWSWQNEFNGNIHGGPDRYERLAELCSNRQASEDCLRKVVQPTAEEMDLDAIDITPPTTGTWREPELT